MSRIARVTREALQIVDFARRRYRYWELRSDGITTKIQRTIRRCIRSGARQRWKRQCREVSE